MRWLVFLLVVLASQPAAAERWYPRATVGVGVGYWIGDVGALAPMGGTVQLSGTVVLTPLTHLRASVEHASLTARDEVSMEPTAHASLDGASLVLHHTIFGVDPKDIRVGVDMHVLAGVERTWISWDETGDTNRRWEAVTGFGGAVVIFDRGHRKPTQQIDYGLRMLFSRAVDDRELPMGCDAPCDIPTSTAPFDFTLVMELSWHFGR
jgi:hypothetical protein